MNFRSQSYGNKSVDCSTAVPETFRHPFLFINIQVKIVLYILYIDGEVIVATLKSLYLRTYLLVVCLFYLYMGV